MCLPAKATRGVLIEVGSNSTLERKLNKIRRKAADCGIKLSPDDARSFQDFLRANT